MGRPRKWTPTVVSAADIVAGAIVARKYGPDLSTAARVRADFRTFCRINRLTPDEAYEPWVGQMRNSGLASGTIREYVEAVTQGERSTAAYIISKAAGALHTDSPTSHATDIDHTTGCAIIESAKKDAPEHAQQLWLLLATGQRRVDIHRLHPQSVKIVRRKTLTVKWLWTKGIQKVSRRREITFPIEDLPDAPKGLEVALQAKRAPFECSVAVLNKCIKRLGFEATTGSFRRLYSARIDAYCIKKGIPKQDMMLHQSAETDKAFYRFNTW